MDRLEDKDRPMPPKGDGVHVRTVARYLREEPNIAMMTVEVWPLPREVLDALSEHVKAAAFAFLRERELVGGEIVDLTAKGPMQ